jgi:CelD/BcsL family acetyltransferase involved in cellulose biosynthesis
MIVYGSADDFAGLEATWNRVALRAPRPSLTHEWFLAWWRAFGNGTALAVTHEGRDGRLKGGAVLLRRSSRMITAAANEYTDDWDVIAIDDSARASLWREIGRLGAAKLDLPRLPGPSGNVSIASQALAEGDYRVAISRQEMSPYLVLPSTWEELLATVSRNQRSKVRRYRKRLEQENGLTFRTVAGSPIDEALAGFLEVEASGWKRAAGTAILQRPRAHRFYTEFAYAAAAKGWLRLHLLELDGVVIAGAYSCVLGKTAFLLKSGFDESYRRLAPGAILRAEALREAISEGLARYEFMGQAEPHKLHWAPKLRERSLIQAYRGFALPEYAYRHKLRPLGRWVRDLIRPRRE